MRSEVTLIREVERSFSVVALRALVVCRIPAPNILRIIIKTMLKTRYAELT